MEPPLHSGFIGLEATVLELRNFIKGRRLVAFGHGLVYRGI